MGRYSTVTNLDFRGDSTRFRVSSYSITVLGEEIMFKLALMPNACRRNNGLKLEPFNQGLELR